MTLVGPVRRKTPSHHPRSVTPSLVRHTPLISSHPPYFVSPGTPGAHGGAGRDGVPCDDEPALRKCVTPRSPHHGYRVSPVRRGGGGAYRASPVRRGGCIPGVPGKTGGVATGSPRYDVSRTGKTKNTVTPSPLRHTLISPSHHPRPVTPPLFRLTLLISFRLTGDTRCPWRCGPGRGSLR